MNLEQYFSRLTEAFNSSEVGYYVNNDVLHNALVIAAMLKNASTVKMFCGKMTLFRKDFRKTLESHLLEQAKENAVDNDQVITLSEQNKKDIDFVIKMLEESLNEFMALYGNCKYCITFVH